MSQTTRIVREGPGYDAPLPSEVASKIKPLEYPITLLWKTGTDVTEFMGSEKDGWQKLPATKKMGIKNLHPRWTVSYKVEGGKQTMTLPVGFWVGRDSDFQDQFRVPRFENGKLTLSPENQDHCLWWEKIQIYPSFQQNVLGIVSSNGYLFELDDKSARDAGEVHRLKRVRAIGVKIDALEKDELALVMKSLSCETELDLERLAQSNPDSVGIAIDNLSQTTVREQLEAMFKEPYGFLSLDSSTNSIVWAEGRKLVYQANASTTNPAEDFTFYITGKSTGGKVSQEAKSLWKNLCGRVEKIDKDLAIAKEEAKKLKAEGQISVPTVQI